MKEAKQRVKQGDEMISETCSETSEGLWRKGKNDQRSTDFIRG
jgi:hypothetical protein